MYTLKPLFKVDCMKTVRFCLWLTLGTLEALHIRAAMSTLRISHAKIVGFSLLHLTIVEMTPGVRSRGRLPPMVFGSRSPVRR